MKRRGQTLVLFALTLLLLSLMVLLTLSFGAKVKEKMEVETVADAAAYSNAVATARVFNEISLMNRAQVGQMVAMAGVQSLISWSGFHRAQLEATRKDYKKARLPYDILMLCCIPFSGCGSFCGCARKARKDINKTRDKIKKEEDRIAKGWDAKDKAAAAQARRIQMLASTFWGFENVQYFRLRGLLNNQKLAGKIVSAASQGSPWSSEWSAPSGGDSTSMQEIALVSGAVLPMNPFRDHEISAAMGSRGWTFTTTRGNGGMVITSRLDQLIDKPDIALATDFGSGYWADKKNHGAYWPSGKYSFGDDDGQNLVIFMRGQSPCPPLWFGMSKVSAEVLSAVDGKDKHEWSPSSGSDSEPPKQRHKMTCLLDCSGIWPMFVDYNEKHVLSPSDVYGQPKNYAVVVRNYHQRDGAPDPWSLFFNFDFSGGQTFDARGTQVGGTDIARQSALSTGIAYYHRHDGSWKEPPNFLNPYWRATLVASDVDASGKSDPDGTLSGAGVGWAAAAHKALRARGFRGWP